MPRKKTTVKKTKQKQKQNVNVRVVVNSNNKRKTVRLGRSQQQQQQPTNFPQVIQVPQFIDRPTQTGFDKNDIINNVKAGIYEIVEAKYNEDKLAKKQNLKDADTKFAVNFSSKQDPAIKDEPKEKEKEGFQEKESVNTGISVSAMKRMLDSVVKKDSKDDDLEPPQTPSSPRIPQFNLDGAGRGAKLVSQATSAVPFKDIGMIRSFLVDIKRYSSKAKAMKLKTIPGREMLENDPALRQQYVDWWNNRAK
jgi:hypothetical protein